VPTLLADPPAAPPGEQPLAPETPGAPPEPTQDKGTEQKCEKCGSALQPGQEWCLNCGAGVPGSLESRSPSWRAPAVIVALTAILALVAAGAAYAALNKKSVHHLIVAVVPATASTPAAPTTPATAGTTATPGATTSTPTTTTAKAPVPLPVKPPKIPLTATPTPTSSTPAPKPAATTPTPTKTTPKTTAPSAPPAKTEPTPILLDTNAVTTYNPNSYPPEDFGDPSLTIDGDSATAWSALVQPSLAPNTAFGLVVNVGSAQKLSALQLITSTPGMTVQVFGAKTTTPPAAITSAEWFKLTQPKVVSAKHTHIKLSDSTSQFSLVLLWISSAPASSVGTPEAPGRVSVNELELFPAT